MSHNIPITRWGNDGTEPCPHPNVGWREWKRADATWHMERGCIWCGWTEPKQVIEAEPFQAKCNECGERLPDDDTVSHYHPGAVIMLEEKKERN